jgi:hypothetical protein
MMPGHAPGSRITPEWVVTPAQPPGTLAAQMNQQVEGLTLMRSKTYDITFAGQAGTTLHAEFDDCAVTVGPATTTLRAELPDQAALSGLVLRITGLGLEVVDLHVVALAPEQ